MFAYIAFVVVIVAVLNGFVRPPKPRKAPTMNERTQRSSRRHPLLPAQARTRK